MKKIGLFFFLLLFCLTLLNAQNPAGSSSKVTLPNGWSLTPAGKGYLLGDLPLNMAVSTSKTLIAVTNNGQSTPKHTTNRCANRGKYWTTLKWQSAG